MFRICDRYTVLRDGRYVGAGDVADSDVDKIIRMMVGRDVDLLYGADRRRRRGRWRWRRAASTRRRDARDPRAIELIDVSLTLRQGEILGLAGLVGAGRTETARAMFGADPLEPARSRRRRDGRDRFARGGDAARHRAGAGGPQAAGAVPAAGDPHQSVDRRARADFARSRWFIDERKEKALIESFRSASSTSAWPAPTSRSAKLSGGNQQKVVLARWLALKPKILIVDEPTRGIDVGAKVEVHNILVEMAKQGIAVMVISSELPEVLALADRIVTMREGRVTGEIARARRDAGNLDVHDDARRSAGGRRRMRSR